MGSPGRVAIGLDPGSSLEELEITGTPDPVWADARIEEIRKRGISILLVEQKLAIALDISERLYVMGHGAIVFEGKPRDVRENAAMRKEWLEV